MDGRVYNSGQTGNRGGGRHSAYQEFKDAEWHLSVWGEDQDIEALQAKIQSGKYCAKDIAALKILQGDRHLLSKLMDKILPDLRKSDTSFSTNNRDLRMTQEEIDEIRRVFPELQPV